MPLPPATFLSVAVQPLLLWPQGQLSLIFQISLGTPSFLSPSSPLVSLCSFQQSAEYPALSRFPELELHKKILSDVELTGVAFSQGKSWVHLIFLLHKEKSHLMSGSCAPI